MIHDSLLLIYGGRFSLCQSRTGQQVKSGFKQIRRHYQMPSCWLSFFYTGVNGIPAVDLADGFKRSATAPFDQGILANAEKHT